MARVKSSGRAKTALLIEEINRGIDMLRKQVAKVEDLKSEGFPYRDAFRARTELQIRESIRRVFGEHSPEFQTHQHYKLRTNTPAEIAETLSILNGLISKLERRKLDFLGLTPEEPSASPPQARTPPNAPQSVPVSSLEVAGAPLVLPTASQPVTQPVTMSISLETDAASPMPATPILQAPSAQPPTPLERGVAAAPPTSPPVQPASVACAPSSAMPPPPLTAQMVAASSSVSQAQSDLSPTQRIKTPPAASRQHNRETRPVSSPPASIPASPSPVQPETPKPHSQGTQATPAASLVSESSPLSAAMPPTPAGTVRLPFNGTDSALPSNAPSMITQPDRPEPDPAAGHRSHPPAASTPAPAPVVEPATRQAALPRRSASRADRPKSTPSEAVGEWDPLDYVRKICTRFHMVVRQLRLRRDYRATLDVEDEYDVQDLFYALLRLEFDEINSEEWMPAYTDCATRTTFFLQRDSIAIVVKKTRPGVGAREIAEQLQVDAERYAARATCKKLFCFVYDPEGRIGNPRGLEMDLTRVSDRYTVELLVAPK